MPYVTNADRWAVYRALVDITKKKGKKERPDFQRLKKLSAGQMNYLITRMLYLWMPRKDDGSVSYDGLSDVIKTLECAKLEFYRRIIGPYENFKMRENGEVYY